MIKIDGSSTVFPITEAVAEEFQISKRGKVRVTVGISGTGGGFKKFCRGETDIQDASRPILAAEMEACRAAGIKYFELPIAYDALTVVGEPAEHLGHAAHGRRAEEDVGAGGAGQDHALEPGQCRSGRTSRSRCSAPGSDSGTFDYFTEAVVGKAKSSRGDFTASEDDNVLVQGVASNKDALGYFGYAYYQPNADKLKAVPIVNKAGKAVGPSLDNVVERQLQAAVAPALHLREPRRPRREPEVREFVEYYLTQSVPLDRGSEVRAAAQAGLRPRRQALQGRQARHRLRRRAGSRPEGRGAARARSEALSDCHGHGDPATAYPLRRTHERRGGEHD